MPCVIAGIDVTSLNLPSDLNIASNVGSSLTSAAGTIDGVLSSGVEATDAIQRYGVTELNKFEATYRQPSTKVRTCRGICHRPLLSLLRICTPFHSSNSGASARHRLQLD